jgi:hypothetical protein
MRFGIRKSSKPTDKRLSINGLDTIWRSRAAAEFWWLGSRPAAEFGDTEMRCVNGILNSHVN